MTITTEHRAESKRCSCGTVTKAALPREARGHTSYGPKIRATALYLMCHQRLPFERTRSAMAHLLAVTAFTGFLDSLYSQGPEELIGFNTASFAELKVLLQVVCEVAHPNGSEMITFRPAIVTGSSS